MELTVLLFGKLGELAGREVRLEVPAGCTVRDVRQSLAAAFPAAADDLLSARVRACVDGAIVGDDRMIDGPGEVALLPPLSGG